MDHTVIPEQQGVSGPEYRTKSRLNDLLKGMRSKDL